MKPTRSIISLDSGLLIRALQEDSAPKATRGSRLDRQWRPSAIRAAMSKFFSGHEPHWALHAAQLLELATVVANLAQSGKIRYRDNGRVKERALTAEESANVREFRHYLEALRNQLQSNLVVPKICYTSMEGEGLGLYMIASTLHDLAVEFIKASCGKLTNPIVDTVICLNAYHQACLHRYGYAHQILTMDGNLGIIQKLIRDHVFDCVRRGSARDCDALPEPLSSFLALFCWSEGGRKTRIMLPNIKEAFDIQDFLCRPPKGRSR